MPRLITPHAPSSPLRRRSGRAGFSLIELLCTVTIMLILMFVVSGPSSANGKRRSRAECQKNLQKIYLALSIYSNDNKGNYPDLPGATSAEGPLSLLVPRSTTTTEIFICPSSKDGELPEGEPFDTRRISYAYYMGRSTNDDGGAALVTDRQDNEFAKTNGQLLFSLDGKKPGNNHGKDGGNVLLCDGSLHFCGPVADRDYSPAGKVRLLNPK